MRPSRPLAAAWRQSRRSRAACPRIRPFSSSSSPPEPVSIADIQAKMATRPVKAIYDVLSPTPSHLLNISLSDYIPESSYPANFEHSTLSRLPSLADANTLPQGHHLVYFPPQISPSMLLPDGTDPDHSPGDPFVRRMWAGGSVAFADGWDAALRLDGREAVCVEEIGDVAVKGGNVPGGQGDKVFVDVWRRYGPAGTGGEDGGVDAVRRAPAVEERRSLVFLREKSLAQAMEDAGRASRVVKAPYQPDHTLTLTPTATLLFHFSALTFNAHAIHLDKQYCRAIEGHRNLLVHGPLSLTLMLSLLRERLQGGGGGAAIRRIEYRNLAPLYAEEPMRVCLREKTGGRAAGEGRQWDVWVEGPEGGMAVRGAAVTE